MGAQLRAYKLTRAYPAMKIYEEMSAEAILVEYLRIMGPQLRETIIKEFTLLGDRYTPRNALNRLMAKGVVCECPIVEILESRPLHS